MMKKLLTYALMIPAFAAALCSCSESKTDVKQLAGKWKIVAVKGEEVKDTDNKPFMEFDMQEKRLHGNAGCNMFNSSFETDDKDISSLKLGMAAATMMACPDMEMEGKILKSMDAVRAVKAGEKEGEMLLVDESGNTVFVLAK